MYIVHVPCTWYMCNDLFLFSTSAIWKWPCEWYIQYGAECLQGRLMTTSLGRFLTDTAKLRRMLVPSFSFVGCSRLTVRSNCKILCIDDHCHYRPDRMPGIQSQKSNSLIPESPLIHRKMYWPIHFAGFDTKVYILDTSPIVMMINTIGDIKLSILILCHRLSWPVHCCCSSIVIIVIIIVSLSSLSTSSSSS